MSTSVSYTHRFFVLLEILKSQSDATHHLQPAELADILQQKYHISADIRSIRKALAEMQNSNLPIQYASGWYYEHGFSFAELDYLADSIRCNNCLPSQQQELLLQKIADLGGKWYQSSTNITSLRTSNEHFLEILDTLHSAIRDKYQVEIYYGDYGIDKKMHPRLNRVGKPKVYELNPYEIVTVNGRYYLVANVHKYDTLSHFRVDRIIDIIKKRRPIKPLTSLQNVDHNLNWAEYIAEHPYMYPGIVQTFFVKVKRVAINHVLDWFGTDVIFADHDDESVVVQIKSDSESFNIWLMRYAKYASILIAKSQ